ncbi:uncharacterized protein [Dysidea avara]|uniref:uncharacterized protein isoform X2 n=1 Tax=Dysidea avara TaxID=196820 RepID=UPI003323E8D6
MITLLPRIHSLSIDDAIRQYTVRVTSIRQDDTSEASQDVLFITNSEALAVEPFAQARSGGVTIKWSTPRINTGCDGSVITRYTINYTLVESRDDYIQVDVDPDQSVMVDIDGLVNSTEYRYFVVSVDQNGGNAHSVSNVFTTIDDYPVSFFNLRLTSDSSFSLDLEQTSSQLTQQISSAITDMCQCVLPDYTLRGTMELCDDQQSNCAVYTGRILSSDMATASELFEQVEVWLSAQNGSLLNGALAVDSSCPLRHLSPSDSVCSNLSDSEDDSEYETSDQEAIDIIEMVGIGFGIGLVAIIVCSLCICVCVSKRKQNKPDTLTLANSNPNLSPFLVASPTDRHYSETNPSYNRHHGKVVKPIQKTVFDGGCLEVTSDNDNRYSTNENPYSYTSLKTVQRQADIVIPEIQIPLEEDETFNSPKDELPSIHQSVDMEQPNRTSTVSANDYVVDSLQSSGCYSNEQELSTFQPPSYDRETYLSIS